MKAATGKQSHVVLNLTARQAIVLATVVENATMCPCCEGASLLERCPGLEQKVEKACERAQLPWEER